MCIALSIYDGNLGPEKVLQKSLVSMIFSCTTAYLQRLSNLRLRNNFTNKATYYKSTYTPILKYHQGEKLTLAILLKEMLDRCVL